MTDRELIEAIEKVNTTIKEGLSTIQVGVMFIFFAILLSIIIHSIISG